MTTIYRILLLLQAFLTAVGSARQLIILGRNSDNIDALWGPNAYPFNLGASFLVIVGYVLIGTSKEVVNKHYLILAGGFISLDLMKRFLAQESTFLVVILILSLYAARWEVNKTREKSEGS